MARITKSDRTRTAILNAALDFVWNHHFRDLTVRTLMASTGASRSAFYHHFKDRHEVMATLLDLLQEEILVVAEPWLARAGDPVALLHELITGLVEVCYERGPFLRAITDAAAADERFDESWTRFLTRFDDLARVRIEEDQKQGLTPDFDARPVAIALNRLNAQTLIQAFGEHPRNPQEPVREALARIWVSTLYGTDRFGKRSSTLVRT